MVSSQQHRRKTFIAFALDAAIVIVFVAIGRSAHRDGVTTSGMVSTLWPFVVGLAFGWLVITRRALRPTSLQSALIVVVATVALGMVLRVISGQGTAFAFILVAICFLGGLMCLWRLVYAKAVRGHSTR